MSNGIEQMKRMNLSKRANKSSSGKNKLKELGIETETCQKQNITRKDNLKLGLPPREGFKTTEKEDIYRDKLVSLYKNNEGIPDIKDNGELKESYSWLNEVAQRLERHWTSVFFKEFPEEIKRKSNITEYIRKRSAYIEKHRKFMSDPRHEYQEEIITQTIKREDSFNNTLKFGPGDGKTELTIFFIEKWLKEEFNQDKNIIVYL